MKKLIQLFIFLILIIVSFSFYFNFLKTNKTSDLKEIEIKKNSSLLESDNNLIKNLEYNVTFDNNTKYTITAELSELKYEDDIEIVEMQFVTAIFNDKDGIPLIITSKNASYNNLNYNTSFSNNVKVIYLTNVLLSEKLDINFNKNIIKIYENVVYEGLQGTVKADNVKLNLMSKNMEIFMQNDNEKIEISSKWTKKKNMSNIKKFRIKSFKENRSILRLDKISLKFGRKIILDNLNLRLNNGQILGLLGPNGVGKSTIFNLITGLLSPDFGKISINTEKVNNYPIYQRTLKFKIGFVPQHGGFFHDLTVYENLKAIAEITHRKSSYKEKKLTP